MVDIHTGHSYVSPSRSPLSSSRTTWMSEYALPAGATWNEAWDAGRTNSGLALANDIHATLTLAQVNAYITWFGASAANTAAPIQLDGPDYRVAKRLWATAAYSRFIRPDSHRVAADTSGQSPPPPPPPGGCTADYQVTGEWQGGFQAEVTVTAGDAAISGWRVTWTFADGQTVTQYWSAAMDAAGPNVTAENVSWNGALGPGQNTAFGFLGTQSGTNSPPTLGCTPS